MPVSRRLTEDHSTTPTNAISQAASAAVRRGGLCGEGEEARVKQTNQRVSRNRKNTGDFVKIRSRTVAKSAPPREGLSAVECVADGAPGEGTSPRP